jgi:hypothetical protein
VETNSTGGQGSRRAVVPSDDDDKSMLNGFRVIKMSNDFRPFRYCVE